MAQTHSPTRSSSELPSGASGRFDTFGNVDERDVDRRIRADDLAAKRAAVRQRDGDPLGTLDDVVVGEDVAVAIDDEAAAGALPRQLKSRGPSAGSSSPGDGARRRRGSPAFRRRIDVDDRRVDPLGDVGEVHHPGQRPPAGAGRAS